MILKTEISFGPESSNRLGEIADPSARGAEAALETFYYAWHNRDAAALRACWSASPFAEIDSPSAGTVRGGEAIARLYQRAVASPADIRLSFEDVVAFYGESDVVYAGRESAIYTARDGSTVPVEIRCTRYLRYEGGHWRQYHHHGSIDDPDALRSYQQAFGR
jgi:ketosteroid isomerase-like protein